MDQSHRFFTARSDGDTRVRLIIDSDRTDNTDAGVRSPTGVRSGLTIDDALTDGNIMRPLTADTKVKRCRSSFCWLTVSGQPPLPGQAAHRKADLAVS